MEYTYWIVIGVLAGFLAKMQFPAKQDQNLFGLLLVGSVGALVGGWIMTSVSGAGSMITTILSYFVAFAGAALLLFLQRTLTPQRTA